MANKHTEYIEQYGEDTSEIELTKADIALTATLQGYFLKPKAIFGEDVFYKVGADKKLKAIAVPTEDKHIPRAQLATIEQTLGVGTSEMTTDYLKSVVNSYDAKTARQIIAHAQKTLCSEESPYEIISRSYCTEILDELEEENNKRTTNQQERE